MKISGRSAGWSIFLIMVLLIAGGCGKTKVTENPEDQILLDQDNKLLQYFTANNPDTPVIKWALNDLNNDQRDDLVVIYQISKEKNMMRVILDEPGGLKSTNEVPAPVSNQQITFKDIDKKPPMELIIQGMKGTKIGYAIFRIEEYVLIDLFGEGMEDCC